MADRDAQRAQHRRRRERREVEGAASEARRRLASRIAVAAGLLLALAVVVAVAVMGGSSEGGSSSERAGPGATGDFPLGSAPPRRTSDLDAAIVAAGCQAKSFRSEGEEHVPGRVRYAADPPHSGDHAQVPADDDAFTEAPPTEALVHSLEHGRVIVWYRPDLPAPQRGALKAVFDEDPYHLTLAPRAGMPYAVAATAWTKRVGCGGMRTATVDVIRSFRDTFRDRGPEYVP
jgi:hypothetical protein